AGPGGVRPTDDWDRKAYPPADDLLAFETASAPPPESRLRVALDAGARGLQGNATPGKVQEYTVQVEPMLFVDGFRCHRACDPDEYNALALRGRVAVPVLRRTVKAGDVTDPPHPTPLLAPPPHPHHHPPH